MKVIKKATGLGAGRVVLGLTSMSRASGIKMVMSEETWEVRSASWLSKAKEVQRREKENLEEEPEPGAK